jgi:hypothetical protein
LSKIVIKTLTPGYGRMCSFKKRGSHVDPVAGLFTPQ